MNDQFSMVRLQARSDTKATNTLEHGSGIIERIPLAAVAGDQSVADAVARIRSDLASGKELTVNSEGTIYNPADPAASGSSFERGGIQGTVPKAVVASQWYESNPGLQAAEITAMKSFAPHAQYGFLDNGQMYWTVRIHPVVAGERKDWTFLCVYDSDHPQRRYGGSVKVYPVKPNYSEVVQMVNRSQVTPKSVPHTLRDGNGQVYLCSQDSKNVLTGEGGTGITSAATCLRLAMRWVTIFELGIQDQKTWDLFQQHGRI